MQFSSGLMIDSGQRSEFYFRIIKYLNLQIRVMKFWWLWHVSKLNRNIKRDGSGRKRFERFSRQSVFLQPGGKCFQKRVLLHEILICQHDKPKFTLRLKI